MKKPMILRWISLVIVFSLPALPASAKGGSKAGTPALPTWVELGESGAILARQVIPLGPSAMVKTCPAIQITGGSNPPTKMTPRGPAPTGFPVLLCEAVIPSGATSASIGGVPLPLPKATIKHIVVIGDTGCKGDVTGTGKKIEPLEEPENEEEAEEAEASGGSKKAKQDCTKKGWPFKAVAKSAAGTTPDLVIHVGDYVYVKDDTWEMWNDQFFAPAKKLLTAAPWIFVRGNHEICKLHGAGFFFLLDPRAGSSCPSDNSAPYLVNAGGTNFAVMDSAGASCDLYPSCSSTEYQQQLTTWNSLFQAAEKLVQPGSAVLLTHRPVFGAKATTSSSPAPSGACLDSSSAKSKTKGKAKSASSKTLMALNSVLQSAYQNSGGGWASTVVSGHVHTFELITYTGGPLPQIIVGDSGVKLSSGTPPSLSNCNLWTGNGSTSLSLSTLNGLKQFGYGVLNSKGSKLDVFLSDGARALKCDISATSASCK